MQDNTGILFKVQDYNRRVTAKVLETGLTIDTLLLNCYDKDKGVAAFRFTALVSLLFLFDLLAIACQRTEKAMLAGCDRNLQAAEMGKRRVWQI